MTGYLLELFSVFLSFYSSYTIVIVPLWNALGWKRRETATFFTGLNLYIVLCHFTARQLLGDMGTQNLHTFKAYITIPALLLLIWLFRKQIWQMIFLIALGFMYSPVGTGIGTYIAETWFPSAGLPHLAECAAMLFINLLTLPPMLYILKRLFGNPGVKQTAVFLRMIWILPAAFFVITITAGNYLTEEEKNLGFLLLRVLIYAVFLLIIYIVDATLRQVSENYALKEKARLIESQLDLQREQYIRLTENAESIKAARHDMRHHLAVLSGFHKTGDSEKLGAYLSDVTGTIPANDTMICDNYAVNAVAAHYLAQAQSEGVKTETRLSVPEDTGCVSAADLCVIVGNLLENAVEACRNVKNGEKYIRVDSRSGIRGVDLSIVVENSFNGQQVKDLHTSRKRNKDTEGIGLSSVKAICEKYGGILEITIADNVWRAAAFVEMRTELKG